ncbi:MAG: type II secretion system F family protein [Patescibacteria group bacterium]
MAINLSQGTSNQGDGAISASKPDKDKGNGQEDKKKKPESGGSIMGKVNNLLLVFSRVPLKEKLFFVQYLGIMLKAGISLAGGLKTLSAQSANKRFAKIIGEIAVSVEKGTSFTESLKPHQKIFGELFINMVEAGEVSGKLENVLVQLYTQLKKQNELISKVKGAMTYPAVIIVAMAGIGIFMMVKIVPQMIGMLKSFNAELPLATKILITASDALVANGLLAAGILVVSVLVVIQIMRTYRGRYYWQAIVLHMPIISPIVKKVNLAKFSRTISTLLKTDIMIIKTFQITANVLGNLHYRKAVNEMSEKIKKGSQINEVVSAYPKLFPPVVNQIISVGEQTGELDNILGELAEFYEGEVDKIMDNLPSIIEPLLILILGCAVGGMAVAIIMPMYSLGSAI